MSTVTQNNEFETTTGVLWDDPEAGTTWLVSLLSVIIFSAAVIALSVMYFQTEQTEVDIKVIEPQYIALETLTTKQKELLRSSGSYSVDVVGKPVTRERIPVEQAIKMVAQNSALTLPSASAKQSAAPSAPAPTVPVTKPAATPAAVAPAHK